jgi:hypothetical protein
MAQLFLDAVVGQVYTQRLVAVCAVAPTVALAGPATINSGLVPLDGLTWRIPAFQIGSVALPFVADFATARMASVLPDKPVNPWDYSLAAKQVKVTEN